MYSLHDKKKTFTNINTSDIRYIDNRKISTVIILNILMSLMKVLFFNVYEAFKAVADIDKILTRLSVFLWQNKYYRAT